MAFKLVNLLVLFIIQVLPLTMASSSSFSSSSSSSSSTATKISSTGSVFRERDPNNPNSTTEISKSVIKTKMCYNSRCFFRVRIRYPSRNKENQNENRVEDEKISRSRREKYKNAINHMPMPKEILNVKKSHHMYERHIKEEFLDAHNYARTFFKEKPFQWNKSLAKKAQKWAAKLSVPCKYIEHSDTPYGENIFLGRGRRWRATDAVQEWANERSAYNAENYRCFDNQICGHFTQIIWRSTHEIGCARKWCKSKRGVIIVCNYDPPGNYIGENPFEN